MCVGGWVCVGVCVCGGGGVVSVCVEVLAALLLEGLGQDPPGMVDGSGLDLGPTNMCAWGGGGHRFPLRASTVNAQHVPAGALLVRWRAGPPEVNVAIDPGPDDAPPPWLGVV